MNENWRNELITKGAAFDALTEIENQYEFEDGHDHLMGWAKTKIFALPPAQPYTDAEIQKMQDLEQAQFDTMYQLGYEEGKKAAQENDIQVSATQHIENLLAYAHDMGVTLEQAEKELQKVTTQPQRMKARWECKGDPNSGKNVEWFCTNCGCSIWVEFCNFKYCPDCGCYMRG